MTHLGSQSNWPLIKRLFELWNGDSDFRRYVEGDIETLRDHTLAPELLFQFARKLWQDHSFSSHKYTQEAFPELHGHLNHQRSLRTIRSDIRKSCDPQPALFSKWREQQINRCDWQLGPEQNQNVIHMPICFELSSGCSVGCWFCGLNAPKLTDTFPHTPHNTTTWLGVLKAAHEILGDSVLNAALYWATEPFDNPDYEQFCLDFHNLFTVFPQTTTALALADLKRTRDFLKISQENGCLLNRFSIKDVGDLHLLHQHFTAHELSQVELVLQTRESLQPKARSGRLLSPKTHKVASKSISCCTGFLVNMPERSIRLISPCPAESNTPNGYILLGKSFFCTPEDFSIQLKKMMEEHMRVTVSCSDTIRLNRDISCFHDEKGLLVESPYKTFHIEQLKDHPQFNTFLKNGTAGLIAEHYNETSAIEPAITFNILNRLLHLGIIHMRVQP